MAEILEDPPAPVVSLGGGAVASERVRDALARHTVVLLDVDADTAWQRCRNGRPLARDRARFDSLHAERAPLYAGLADAILPADRRDEVRQALPAIRALARRPRGRSCCGRATTRCSWGRGCSARACGRWRAALPRHRLDGRRPLRGPARPGRDRGAAGAGRAPQEPGQRRPRAARAGARGDGPRRPRGRAGRRGGRRRRGLLRGGLPARRAGRPRPDHARLAGRLGLRRQDRRRPARGQELRGRLSPALRRARRPGHARHAAGRGAGRRLGRGDQDRPDRGRGAVASGCAGARRRWPTATSCSPARA